VKEDAVCYGQLVEEGEDESGEAEEAYPTTYDEFCLEMKIHL
jgi:hypothetical protein